MDTHTLSALLRSKTRTAQLLGVAIVAVMFLPDAFRIFGDESLSWTQKGEQITIAIGRTLFTVGAVAVNPQSVIEPEAKQKSEVEPERDV